MRNSLVEVCNILVLQTKELLAVAMNELSTKMQSKYRCMYCYYGIGTHFQTFWRMEPP